MDNLFLVLGANKYDFEQNGEKIKGAKVRYLPNEVSNSEGNYGVRPIEINCDYDKAELFKEGTGFYNLFFNIVPGTRGTPKMILTNANMVKKIDLKLLHNK